MQQNKYFYNGIPISKYCQERNLNIKTVLSRIYKLKHHPKYQNYTEQEIIDLIITSYDKKTNYIYQGQPLSKYCQENNLNLKTIKARIKKLKQQNGNLTNDELVILAIEAFTNQNFKYFYQGLPLKEYCQLNQIKYSTIEAFINREKTKNPHLSYEEIIEQFIKKEHKGIYKYYYLGIPLKQYCSENNLNYKNIISFLNRYKAKGNYKSLSDDELITVIMDQYQPFEPKYVYQGQTLSKYCEQNNISYYSVISFIKRKLAKDPTQNIDDLIAEGINTIKKCGIIYYYKGIPLKDYAKENHLNINSLRSAIIRRQAKCNLPLSQIIEQCVESYQKFSIKYYYDGVPLITYCKNIDLNYSTLIQKYLNEYANNPNISTDEAIKEIITYYQKNPPVKTKYYFHNESLLNYCNLKGYSYLAIWRRIKNLTAQNNLLSNEEIINLAVQKYEERLQITKINQIFIDLKQTQNINEIKNICDFLKISFDNVNDLINMDFSYNQAINMIWYFYDQKNNDDYKMITDQKIKDILILIANLPNTDIENLNLYDLIGIYKSELYDSRNEILMNQKKFVSKTIFSVCQSYNIEVNNSNYGDFENEINYYLLIMINRINLNNIGQIINYINISIKGYFKTYLKNYQKQNNSLPFDENRQSLNIKENLIDLNNPNNSIFSPQLMNILSTLPSKDLSFIVLKYQENYSNEELAKYFNLSIEEVIQKETTILNILQNNNQIKVLAKIKKD